jgi:flagellar motor switch protein FliG
MPAENLYSERDLNGPEKAAALLLMMGKSPAARILKQFDQIELRAVARAAAGLGPVPAITLDRLVEEFIANFSLGPDLLGDVSQARSLLADTMPADEIADALQLTGGDLDPADPWRLLGQAPESAIVALLTGERPATAAYILSKLDPAVAASIVAALPRDRRNAALCSMVMPLAAPPLAARLIEETLRGVLKAAPKAATGADERSRIASIINGLDPAEAEDAVRALERIRPKDAAVVKSMLFGFNDLPRLSARARALLFDRASIDIVVMALRGTDGEFRDVVLSSMPARGRRLVEGELNTAAPVQPQEIAKARKAVAEIVLGMAARGEIELPGAAAEDPE